MDLLPSLTQVGAYIERNAFNSMRPEAAQWVFWPDRVKQILAGEYGKIKPLHIELSPTYLCNYSCPWCSCRSARSEWCDDNVFLHPRASNNTVMPADVLNRVIEELGRHNIAIQWVGGEPTIHPNIYSAMQRAHELGLPQCIFTNGSGIGPKRIEQVLESQIEFVRISLDAISPAIHRVHHGYSEQKNYLKIVLRNLELMIHRKLQLGLVRPLVGVSVVVDETNINDLFKTAEYLCGLVDRFGAGTISYVLVRLVAQYPGVQANLLSGTDERLHSLIEKGGELDQQLAGANITLIELDHYVLATTPAQENDRRCLAGGMFGELKPTGEWLSCSDKYGDPTHVVGSLAQDTIEGIYSSRQRAKVLASIADKNCSNRQCPKNGRGYMLNRIFSQVEAFRQRGEIDQVQSWIDALKRHTPRPEHPFFI